MGGRSRPPLAGERAKQPRTTRCNAGKTPRFQQRYNHIGKPYLREALKSAKYLNQTRYAQKPHSGRRMFIRVVAPAYQTPLAKLRADGSRRLRPVRKCPVGRRTRPIVGAVCIHRYVFRTQRRGFRASERMGFEGFAKPPATHLAHGRLPLWRARQPIWAPLAPWGGAWVSGARSERVLPNGQSSFEIRPLIEGASVATNVGGVALVPESEKSKPKK